MTQNTNTVVAVAAAAASVALGSVVFTLVRERTWLASKLEALVSRVAELSREATQLKRTEEGLLKELESLRLASKQQQSTGTDSASQQAKNWQDAYNEAAVRLKQVETALKDERQKSTQWREKYERLQAKVELRTYTAAKVSSPAVESHVYIPAHA